MKKVISINFAAGSNSDNSQNNSQTYPDTIHNSYLTVRYFQQKSRVVKSNVVPKNELQTENEIMGEIG